MRTAHVDEQGNPKYTNRLVDEASPYLVQHAHNPVDWFPWGTEAFEEARRHDKPVFLSIGYSTCHWCHVMEHESFDDEAIAEFLNEHFISIKLDREQRPDLDDVYMTGVQMLTGQGGWPMSNFLTPDGEPFYAGTYFPPDHFLALLEQIVGVWKERREDVTKQAREIAQNIARFTSARAESKQLGDNLIDSSASEILGRFDEANGGFGGAPKFPNEMMLAVLLDHVTRSGNADAMRAATLTLDKMYQGGIFDQIAGGFHRYTVDAAWLVPHFEKMLYNQAQLLRVYSQGARLTGNVEWRRVATQLVDFLLRDMTDPDGTFYSATDADSEGEEGKFFVWTPVEFDDALEPDDAEMARALYQVTDGGNFEGANILNPGRPLLDFARERGLAGDEFFSRLDRINARLYDVRERREHPVRDEKIITGWNAMMITSLALAGQDLGEADWIGAAERAAETLWSRANNGGALWRISVGGVSSTPGNLEDYAFFAEAALVLFAVTGDTRYRVRGEKLVWEMIERFWDTQAGGFFLSLAEDDGPMITRPKSPMDGATASANSAALHALVLLWRQTGNVVIEEKIASFINAFAGLVMASPSAFSYMNLAIENYRSGQTGVVQFAGGGNVRVRLEAGRLVVDIADGWHINPNVVADEDLIPTTVEADGASVNYPEGGETVWEGEVGIDISGDADTAVLTLQPCNGELCMAPERLTFRLRG